MIYNYADNHHHQFVHKHTQPLPDPEFPYRKALPHRFHSFQPPPKCVPEAWHAEGGEPSQFDHPQQPSYQPGRYSRGEIPRTAETARVTEFLAKLDHLHAAFDKLENKWDATNRRVGKLHAPPRPEPAPNGGEHRSARQPWRDDRRNHRQCQSFEEYPGRHQQPHNGRTEQLRQPSCWDPPSYRRPRQPTYHPPEVLHTQPTYQPPQSDQSLSHRTTPLPAVAPPQSGSTHHPQQSSKFIDSGKQCGLPNIPNLKVRSPCPAQLATVRDYNDKLRIYRFEQAALLPRVNAWFEENIDDENLAKDVPDNATHNGGANLDVPNEESLEEIFKTDNMPLQVLVGACDENIGDLIVPSHRELEIKDELLDDEEDGFAKEVKKVVDSFSVVRVPSKNVVRNCWGKKGGGDYTALLEIVCVNVDLNAGKITSMNHRSISLDTDARLIPPGKDAPCLSILGGVDKIFVLAWNFADHIGYRLMIFDGGDEGRRLAVRCAFDPGGDALRELLLLTPVVASWLPP